MIEPLDALGVAEYLTKPYNVDRPLEVIDKDCPTIDTVS